VSIPTDIRDEVTTRLWKLADELRWFALPATSRSRHYDNWAIDPSIGGRLSRFLDPGQVRLYIKDAVMKRYARDRRARPSTILGALSISDTVVPVKTFIKPHGWQLQDGRVFCWGRANTWKLVLMAVHERSFGAGGCSPYGAVLTQAAAHFADDGPRAVVEDAASKLGINRVKWLLE
jgi:hypothetical protein